MCVYVCVCARAHARACVSLESPEQYAEAFQQMIDARERWREQVREQEVKSAR